VWGIILILIAVVIVVGWWTDFFHIRGDTAPAGPGAGISPAATAEAKASSDKRP
jgi:hypothetical protein